jgi:hypothetical protein
LQGVVELFSPHPLFSVEFIMGIWFLSFVAASDTNNQQNHNMKAITLLTQILACCAIGWFSVKAAILLHTFVHSY